MSQIAQNFSLLKWALLVDAATSAATGLLLVFAANTLASLLGLPSDLLLYCGLFFIPWAAVLAFVATRRDIKPAAVWPIAVLNLVWGADSFLLLASIDPAPTLLGSAFITVQAVVVLGFAGAQIVGLKRRKAVAAFQSA
ncbi:hypothetical protein [Kordiimonas sp.]|uniref:hypothetical protein n=1 Tax=Kordiimonas sp. TaxID=1970157 RepID=UPI003A8DA777